MNYRFLSLLLLAASLPQLALAQGIQSYIVTATQFLNNAVLPALFAVAFLVFLVNLTRYFILQGASDEGREKAKRNALWGILAFVLLISLWTITSLLLQGLNITGTNDAICPDYLTSFGNSGGCSERADVSTSRESFSETTFPAPTPTRPAPAQTSPSGGATRSDSGASSGGSSANANSSNSGGSTSGGEQESSDDVPPPPEAHLAELIFGDGRDGASLVNNDIVAAAQNSTLNIAQAAACTDAVLQLQNYAKNAPNQAAYVYHENDATSNWLEVTDSTSRDSVGIDRTLITNIGTNGSNSNIHLFHTHPAARTDAFTLDMNGHGPTRADFNLMCNIGIERITHHVVDSHGIWTYQAQADTCPYPDGAQTNLGKIETYLALSVLRSGQRSDELDEYVASPLTNTAYDSEFGPLVDTVGSYQPDALRNLSTDVQTATKTFVTYEDSINVFCNSL